MLRALRALGSRWSLSKCHFPLRSAGLCILLPPKMRFSPSYPMSMHGLEAAERQWRVAFTRGWIFTQNVHSRPLHSYQRMFLLLLLQHRHLNPVLPWL